MLVYEFRDISGKKETRGSIFPYLGRTRGDA